MQVLQIDLSPTVLIRLVLYIEPVMGRTKIGPYVDDSLWRRFRDEIPEDSSLGEELDDAIRAYLVDEEDTKIKALVEEVQSELRDEENPSGEVVSGA